MQATVQIAVFSTDHTDDYGLRHDLSKALRFAPGAGFNGAPTALPQLAALFGPYYQVHAISQMPPEAVASVCWALACATVRDLIDAVAAGFEASHHKGVA